MEPCGPPFLRVREQRTAASPSALRLLRDLAGAAAGESLRGLRLRLLQSLQGVDVELHSIHLLSPIRAGARSAPAKPLGAMRRWSSAPRVQLRRAGSHIRAPPSRSRRRKASTPLKPVLKSATTE